MRICKDNIKMSPRTKKQFAEMREQSRQKILTKALELFVNHGFDGTTISMIAKASGVSQGLLYNYYKSKDDLLEAVVMEGIKIIKEMMLEMAKGDPPEEILKHMLEITFTSQFLWDDTFKKYFSLILQPHIYEKYSGKFSELLELTTKEIEKLLSKIGFANPAVEARIVVALLDGIGMHYWVSGNKYPIESVKQSLIDRYCIKNLRINSGDKCELK